MSVTESAASAPPNGDGLPDQQGDFSFVGERQMHIAAALKRIMHSDRALAELAARRERAEISQHSLDPNFLHQLNQAVTPLRRSDLENQAVVLTFEEMSTLGFIDFIHSSGTRIFISAENFPSPAYVLVLFSEDLGDQEQAA